MFEQATAELEPDVRLIKLNAGDEPQIASELGGASIPARLVLRGGRIVARTGGAMDTRPIVN
jgi:thioredoxin 2